MKTKKQDDKNPIKGIIVMAILALLVLAYFYVINNRMKRIEEDVGTISPVQELLIMNLSESYPNTPKEVVKLYSEITRCFYAEKYDEAQLKELALMSRQLFDTALLENQSDDDYLRALRNEIATYKKDNRVISSYSVSSSADVEYYRYMGDDWAQIIVMYSIRTGGKIEPSKERYLLRKDADGHWKIFGFKLEPIEEAADAGE